MSKSADDFLHQTALLLHETYNDTNINRKAFHKMIECMSSYVEEIYVPHLKCAFAEYLH